MIKGIDFSNPGHLKLCLLSQGINVVGKRIFKYAEFAENQYPYGYSSKLVKKFKQVPSELILPGEVVVGLHFRKKSPWSLTYELKDKSIYLTHKGKKITKVWFNPKPHFYGEKLASGLRCERVAVMYGLYTLSLFTRGWCYYFIQGLPCKFCSLAPTRSDLGKKNVLNISPQVAREAVQLALSLDKGRILYVNYTAGACRDNDLGIRMQLKVLRAVKKITPSQVKHHLLTIPPDDFSLIKELKAGGLGTLNFAIEVFDPDLFKEICPGKEKYYGYEKYMQVFDEAVRVFGKGKMYANFVAGLEPLASITRGFSYFAKRGIAPSVNVFHPDPGSKLADKAPPSIEYLLEVAKAQTEIYSRNHFKAIYPKGGTRNSLDTEVYRGFFK